jgi:uncharacterized protein YbjT (DUF2867 family)
MANVLIVGASRGLGLETVRAALGSGYSVRALSRSAPEKGVPDAEWIEGGATEIATMLRASEGMDAVVTCLGHPPTRRPVTLFSQAATVAVAAMRANDVRRLVAVTGLGAGDSRGVGDPLSRILRPLLLGRIYADKDREEEIVRASGLDWTILRPAVLTRLPAKGRCDVIVDPARWRAGFVSRADAAQAIVASIGNTALVGATPEIVDDI